MSTKALEQTTAAEEKEPLVFPKGHVPEIMECLLGDLVILIYERGQVVYSYPHPLPRSYWAKPATVIADGVEIACNVSGQLETFFQFAS